jgi:hypothetical protein
MQENAPNPQINVSKIQGGGGAAGSLFAVISMLIFLIGIPALRYFLPAAIVLGGAVALAIHFKRHDTTGAPWIAVATKK